MDEAAGATNFSPNAFLLFLRSHGIAQRDIETIRTAIALGIAFSELTEAERARTGRFKEDIIQAFHDGIRYSAETILGNIKADVLADKDRAYRPENFYRLIRAYV